MKRRAPGKRSAVGTDMIANINYHDYLCLDDILGAQRPMSLAVSGKMAHDEMLFITIHQTYEIWFKQILHEVDSVRALMQNVPLANNDLFTSVQRLNRVAEIQKILVGQLHVLNSTMTPLSFLEFREFLGSSSGFQSYQFRLFETRLGLKREKRMNYGKEPFCTRLKPEQATEIRKLEEEPSLFDCVETWLERTPMIMVEKNGTKIPFWEEYMVTVRKIHEDEKKHMKEDGFFSEEQMKEKMEGIDHNLNIFENFFDEDKYNEMIKLKKKRLSHKAAIAAIMITLYQEEAIFHLPFQLLTLLVDMDQHIRTWRYKHALMVHRMLGMKVGTGGSSGYHYLKATASQHMIFNDFFDLSMFLIPRDKLTPLHEESAEELGFAFDVSHRYHTRS